MKKSDLKMNPDELQGYLHFKHRGGTSKPKKGKGSYNRKNQKAAYYAQQAPTFQKRGEKNDSGSNDK